MFITNTAALQDPACVAAMAAYAERIRQEQQHRQEILQGRRPAPSWGDYGTWTISDRD
jgi:hypothetical protein